MSHKLQLTAIIIISASISFMVLNWLTPPQAVQAQPTHLEYTLAACVEPTTDVKHFCQAEAQKLLATTVRLEIKSMLNYVEGVGYVNTMGKGHGTVREGRYLVTHNHYPSITYDHYAAGELKESAKINVFRSNGELLSTYEGLAPRVVGPSAEMVVLDFGLINGQGYFAALGIASADFASGGSNVQSGDVVGQINWNSANAIVDWVYVRSVGQRDGVPVVILDNTVIQGASGGGIFHNGQHIANNWKYIQLSNAATEEIIDAFSVGALNGGS